MVLRHATKLFHFTFIIPTSTGASNAPNMQERYYQQDCPDLAMNFLNIAAINPQSLMFYALGTFNLLIPLTWL